MKKLILLGLILGTIFSKAHAFSMRANVRVTPLQVTGQVYNHFNRPIICNMEATGNTAYGQSLYSYMNQVMIRPGMHGYVYIYSNPTNPFTNAYAQADCYWY